jgi:hypothetical protein
VCCGDLVAEKCEESMLWPDIHSVVPVARSALYIACRDDATCDLITNGAVSPPASTCQRLLLLGHTSHRRCNMLLSRLMPSMASLHPLRMVFPGPSCSTNLLSKSDRTKRSIRGEITHSPVSFMAASLLTMSFCVQSRLGRDILSISDQ